MSSNRRRLLEALLQKEGLATEAAAPAIPRRPAGEAPRPSVSEEQLVAWSARFPTSPAYHLPYRLEFGENPDADRLTAALFALVRRHSALRAAYGFDAAGRVVKSIAEEAPVSLDSSDLSALPAAVAASRLAELETHEARRPFRLDAPPLLRAHLVLLPQGRSVLIVVLHHLVADGWSLGILWRDLEVLYRDGDAAVLEKLPICHDDWASWQRRYLAGAESVAKLEWWRQHLAAAPHAELPQRGTSRGNDSPGHRRGGRLAVALDDAVAARLFAFARKSGVSPFVAVTSLWAAVLQRFCGQDDLVIGTGAAHRDSAEIRHVVGFFADILPLRLDLAGSPSLRQAFGRVQHELQEAFAHALPFETLIEGLAPHRDNDRAPFFESLLTLEGEEDTATSFAPQPIDIGTVKFDLSLDLRRYGDRLTGVLEYDRDLYPETAIERLASHWQRLAELAGADPDRPLADFDLLEANEHAKLASLASAFSPYPREATVDQLFAEMAAARPQAIALSAGDRKMSYGELDAAANRLARHLIASGAGPEVAVGICLERSFELIVASLAVVKAGAFYVPLDRSYPAPRLTFMLGETGARLLITHAQTAGNWPEAVQEIDLDRDAAAIAAWEASPLPRRGLPDNLLYVMFTSGSTGKPKGVACTHRNVVRLVCGNSFARLADQVFLQLAPTSFDAATLEIWGALLGGGRLAIHPPGPVEPAGLARVLAAEKVTTLWLTASLFHRMADEEPAALLGLEQLLAGGEVLSPLHVERLLAGAEGSSFTLINGYGPTENTTFTACHSMCGRQKLDSSVPIGRPIANTSAWVLDRQMRPLPIGVVGELYTGGDGLARGYFGQRALTAERFVPDPRGDGARLYRTGDLFFRHEDGLLYFAGRADSQVKIRGFRIEPDEIAAQLLTLEGVREAVVVVREDSGEKRLVAYLVSSPDTAPDPAAWRAALADRLPSYLVPAALVCLERLPLTANGKLDRRALPPPDDSLAPVGAPPAGATEMAVAAVWTQLLGREILDREANFFELGGHSLSLTQAAARVREALACELPLALFFENLELAELAAAIDRFRSDNAATTSQLAPSEPPPFVLVGEPAETAVAPLSFAQERLYFLNQLDPGNSAYNVALAFELTGPLDLPALAGAFGDLIARHAALRTRFVQLGGLPQQEVLPPWFPDLIVDEPNETAARSIEEEEAGQIFDLAAGPPLKVRLLRLGPTRHRLLFVQHHIITDGWSVDLLLDELFSAYAARCRGERWQAAAAAQYPEYATWQRRWLEGGELDRQLAFWRGALTGCPSLELSTDWPRPAVPQMRGGELAIDLTDGLLTQLERLANEGDTTLFTVFLAALRATLVRLGGQGDFAIGTIVANRPIEALETMAGFCANTLALRTRLEPRQSFRALLAAERQTALAAWAHQDLPFARLVEELAPQRDLARTPIFQVLATLRRESAPREWSGLTVEAREIYNSTAKFDLAFGFLKNAAGCRLVLEFDLDLFTNETAEIYLACLRNLLQEVTEQPDLPLADLPLTRDTASLIPSPRPAAGGGEGTLHELFFSLAAAQPEATALTSGTVSLSYGELAQRAQLLAAALADAGAAPEVAIGLCLERSAELVIGILGVLAAGAAYLPVDPTAPEDRLAYILSDAAAPLLLTQRSLRGRIPADYRGRILLLEELDAAPGRVPPQRSSSDHLAYIIYTSGSTGRPKGSPISHRNALRLFAASSEICNFQPADVFTQFHSSAFDFSVWEIWGALLHGGRLVMVSAEQSRSPADFYRLLAAEKVTVISQTPSAFSHLLATEAELNAAGGPATSAFATVRQIFLGGEAIDLVALRPFIERHPAIKVINLYGPTETTVGVTLRQITMADIAVPHRSPLGVGLLDVALLLLDREQHLVPNAVPGEICISGPGLSRGYLGRPGLTAERFIPNPYAAQPGDRLYRTGDLAKRHHNGDLLYLGRIDQQIKLRGFRIELGEITARLVSHPALRDAAVLLRNDVPGEPRLVAYWIPRRPDALPSDAELRLYLGKTLPEYMVPHCFVPLEVFPLNVNGKLDRAALPALEAAQGPARRSLTPAEALLAAIWSEALGVPVESPDADFFALGGHSLKAAQVIARMRERLGIELPLRELFATPRLEVLAARLTTESQGATPAGPLLRADAAATPLLSFAQERMYFLDRLTPGSSAYLIPLLLHFGPGLDHAALAAAFTAVTARHAPLRTTFRTTARGVEAQILPPSPLALRVHPQTLTPAAADALIAVEAVRPFDLLVDLPLRTLLYPLTDGSTKLLLVLHHIAADLGSLSILLDELAATYAMARRGEADSLPALSIAYSDFARWQRELFEGPEGARQLAYWRKQLAALPALELPWDRPRSSVRGQRGGRVEFSLDRGLGSALEELAPKVGATPFLVLLAAFATLLGRLAGQHDFALGTPITGRPRTELEKLIGLFLNTLVLRIDLRPAAGRAPDFATVVGRLRETLLAAWAHQDLPFERLADALAPARDLGSTPFFQVLFSYQNEVPTANFAELDVELVPLDNEAAKVDLALLMGKGSSGFVGVCTYDVELFDRATIERLMVAFKALLAAAIAQPTTSIAALPLLGPAEAARLIAFNDTARPLAPAITLPDLFAASLAADPDGEALVTSGERLTRRNLMQRARQLAHHLRDQGVGPEVVVGLCLPRQADLIVSLMAILEAGGAYLPLDPDHPETRRRQLLQQAGARLLITTSSLALQSPGLNQVLVDQDQAAIAARPFTRVENGLLPENLAYVLFTSGSTGEPKAVAVEHHRLANYLASAAERIAAAPGWSYGMVSTIAADVGHTALFGSLVWGGALHLIDRATALDPEAFSAYRQRHRLDLLKIVPSHLEALLAGKNPALVLPEICLVLGGENPRPALLARIAQLRPSLVVFNSYGPTETTAAVATREVEGLPRLGRPLGNLRFYVVDRELGRLPLGLPGELLIGGMGVARGYLGQPALTAERFLPDPYSGEPGARLYRTGDQVKRLPDGEILFLGRRDHQVKIRGYRIELGEVENALRLLPEVHAAMAAIVGHEDDSRLVAAAAVGDKAAEPGLGERLRAALRSRLPEPMVPTRVVPLPALPLNANGKLDRPALTRQLEAAQLGGGEPTGTEPAGAGMAGGRNTSELAGHIAGLWQRLLGVTEVGQEDNFFDLGGHSLLLVRLQVLLREELGYDVPVVDLFTYPTVGSLARHLVPALGRPAELAAGAATFVRPADRRIAIIGMSGRFPGAGDLDTFWNNLAAGVESIAGFRAEEPHSSVDPSIFSHPDYVDARGALPGVEDFDAPLFGFRPQEAALTDPQQRVFLEAVWEAFEDAGLDPARAPGKVGVFAGSSQSTYFLNHIFSNPALADVVWALETRIGNDKDFLPTRVAYKFGLEGPAVAVQTSCSTSLVAVHLACRSLLEGDCDVAVAGGVRISLPQQVGYLYQPGGVASPDGHCRAFSADAQGTVPGNGCGVVILKRLADAEAAGDLIDAVILGSAINNDGARKVGYTAPGVDGQRRAISAALADASLSSVAIDYVETHGTGTRLGDPIELAALRAAYGREERPARCLLGALKTNIGHLDAAAGVAGLIKTVLALRHQAIPPTLHFERANPELGLEDSPFTVAATLTPWPRQAGRPRRAGVSSFGIGGTNAHVVLEEGRLPVAAPAPSSNTNQAAGGGARLLLISAHDPKALEANSERLATHLATAGKDLELAAVAHTLAVGRRRLGERRFVVARDLADAANALRSPQRRFSASTPTQRELPLVFLFPGQGTQYPGMGRQLYTEERHFRAAIDRGADWLLAHHGCDLRPLLFPAPDRQHEAALRLSSTELTQPALFIFEHALAELFLALGFSPAAMIGHSIGEYVAATLAGVFSYEDGLALVAERGRMIAALPPGAMAAVAMSASALAARLPPELAVAAENAPESTVIAGEKAALEACCADLAKDGVECRRLHVSHAFHSPMLDGLREGFAARVAAARPQQPRLPFVSNLTGAFITAEEAQDPEYWASHLRQTVRFDAGAATLLAGGPAIFLEVGPGRTLCNLLRRQPLLQTREQPVIAALPAAAQSDTDDFEAFLESVGRLWLAGREPRLDALFPGRKVKLPTYAFQRRRCWIEPNKSFAANPVDTTASLETPLPAAAAPGSDALSDRGTLSVEFVAPRSEVELALAELWQKSFGIRRIGIHDSFFELGGDSLLAARLVGAMRSQLGYAISVADLIRIGTIAGLAPLCEGETASGKASERLQDLVGDLDRLSVEELEALLAEENP